MNAKHLTIIVLLLFFLLVPKGIMAFGHHGASLNIQHKEAEPGSIVDVAVTTSGLNDLGAFDCWIHFNEEVLGVISMGNVVVNIHPSLTGIMYNVINNNTVALSWSSVVGVDLPEGEKLFDLRFVFCNELLDCALNETRSFIDFIENQTHFTTTGLEEIPATYNNGSVYSAVALRILTLAIEGNGKVEVNGAEYTEPVVDFEGTVLSLNAVADDNHSFIHWKDENDDVLSTVPGFEFTLAGEDAGLTAVFAPDDSQPELYALSLSALPSDGGTVDGDGQYPEGADVVIVATPAQGYHFVHWTDADSQVVSEQPVYGFTMPASELSLTAHFAINTYTITATAVPEEGGTVSGAGEYGHGQTVEMNAVANTGYHFVHWAEGGEVVATDPLYSFTATSDRELQAHFAINTYVITATATTGGSISPSGSVEVVHGHDQAFDISPEEGYRIAGVRVDGQDVGAVDTYVFEEVASDHSIHAEFTPITYEVSFRVNMTYVTTDYAGFDFDPENDTVYLAGNFSGEWQEPGSDPGNQAMTPDQDNPMIYTLTLQLQAGNYAYKYFLNPGWDGGEWAGDPNRMIEVGSDMEVNDWFGSLTDPTHADFRAPEASVRAYPLPATHFLYVEYPGPIGEVQLIDPLGRIVYQSRANGSLLRMDVSDLKTGIYFLRVSTRDGVQTLRVMRSE